MSAKQEITETPEQKSAREKEEKVFQDLTKFFHSIEKDIQVKNASYGTGRVDYIRGKDFEKVIKEKAELVCKEINNICEVHIAPDDEEFVQWVFEEFHERKMFMKAQRHPDDLKKKYVKRLLPLEEQIQQDDCCGDDHGHGHGHKSNSINFNSFDINAIYVLNLYDPQFKTRTYFWLISAVVVVLLGCLFPVWPLELKLAVWWISYILLMIMVVLIIVRLQVYMLVYIFGVDLWIFPNMFDDRVFI